MPYIRHNVSVFIFPNWAVDREAAQAALDALPPQVRRSVMGPVFGAGHSTVVVAPGGETRLSAHQEASDAVSDALLRLTPFLEMVQVQFGGDEDYAALLDSSDSKAWVPQGATIENPRGRFFAPEDLYRGAWVDLGHAARARQALRYFELLPEARPERGIGLSAARQWLERLGSDRPPNDDDLERLRDLARHVRGFRESEGLAHLVNLIAAWQGVFPNDLY